MQGLMKGSYAKQELQPPAHLFLPPHPSFPFSLYLFILEVFWSLPPLLVGSIISLGPRPPLSACSATVGSLCSWPLCWNNATLRQHVCICACVCYISSASLQSQAALPTPTLRLGFSQPGQLWNAVTAELHRDNRRQGHSVFLTFKDLRLKQEVTHTGTHAHTTQKPY